MSRSYPPKPADVVTAPSSGWDDVLTVQARMAEIERLPEPWPNDVTREYGELYRQQAAMLGIYL